MNYKELLNRTIKKSGLKNVELIEKLKEMGVTMTPNYLSVLRNDDNKIASPELSRAIAKACGEPDELLVVQGDLDRLSGYLKTYISMTVKSVIEDAKASSLRYEIEDKEKAEKALSILSNMCEADFICDYVNNPDEYETAEKEWRELVKNGFADKIILTKKYAVVPMALDEEIRYIEDLKDLDKLEP